MGQSSLRAESIAPKLQGCQHPLPCRCLPKGLQLQPRLGPALLRTGSGVQNPPFSQLAGVLHHLTFTLHLRKARSRNVCTLGPGLPLSAPAASQHLGKGCGPDWTPGPPHSVHLRPIPGQGLESISYVQPPSRTPFGTRLGPHAPQQPVLEGLPPGIPPEPPSQAPPVIAGVRALSLGLHHTTRHVHTPPVLPGGPLDAARGSPVGLSRDVFPPQLTTVLQPGSRRSQGCAAPAATASAALGFLTPLAPTLVKL